MEAVSGGRCCAGLPGQSDRVAQGKCRLRYAFFGNVSTTTRLNERQYVVNRYDASSLHQTSDCEIGTSVINECVGRGTVVLSAVASHDRGLSFLLFSPLSPFSLFATVQPSLAPTE